MKTIRRTQSSSVRFYTQALLFRRWLFRLWKRAYGLFAWWGLIMLMNNFTWKENYRYKVQKGQGLLTAPHFNAEFLPSLTSQQRFSAIGPVSTSVSQLMRTIPVQSHINPQTCTTSHLRPVNVVTVARAHHFTAAHLVVQPYIIYTFHVNKDTRGGTQTH